MATTADFKNGLCIVFKDDLYTIVQFQHVKPGKGPAFVRTKLRNVKTGRVLENTFTSGIKIDTACRIRKTPIFNEQITGLETSVRLEHLSVLYDHTVTPYRRDSMPPHQQQQQHPDAAAKSMQVPAA